ncbi:MAG: TIGR02996 domain-containing protein [Planctomycetes bacterium]|nr:TIGR02996 domain-containing protein [Planctomycetota bacterium]
MSQWPLSRTSEDQGFLAALRAQPTDDTLKLVYADWLEEHGDPRAEFIRLSISLRDRQADEKGTPMFLARWNELRLGISPEWIALVDRTCSEDDVREAVFRHLFGRHHNPKGVYFISTADGKDPSPQLLCRFEHHRPPVKPASASQKGENQHSLLLDRESGKKGILFGISKMTRTKRNIWTVEAAHYLGPLAAAGYQWKVVLKEGKWQVASGNMLWIS